MIASAARLKRYAPGLRQADHVHERAHLSLVLAGGFEEFEARRGGEALAGQLVLRPEGLRHAVNFEPRGGAVVLSFEAPTDDDEGCVVTDLSWSGVLPRDQVRRLTPLLLEGGEAGVEAAWDMLALARSHPCPDGPDPWLRAVRDRLVEAPGGARLTDIAHQAGRHRVHMGRAFLAAYGETPSAFRRRSMLDRALCLTAHGLPAALAALDAGFSDQSHFNRACRDIYGLPPVRLMAGAA